MILAAFVLYFFWLVLVMYGLYPIVDWIQPRSQFWYEVSLLTVCLLSLAPLVWMASQI